MNNSKKLSFVRSLCLGRIEEEALLPYPVMKDEEKDVLKEVVRSIDSWAKGHEAAGDFRAWDRQGEFAPEVLDEMKNLGLFGLVVPEEFGGLALSSAAYSRTLQQLAQYDGSVAVTTAAHSSIGMRGLLLFGTPEQKQRYLARLATGELIAAFCLTEPGAGSDAASIKTRAVKDGDDWILNGQKLWITNGGIAGFYTVFAKTESEGKGKITAFIVERDRAGVSTGPHEDKMGLRASSTTTVMFDNVRVPAENVLGGVGKGFKVAMGILNSGRIGLGGACVGGMKRGVAECVKQAKGRAQFGRPIAQFGLIQQKIGQMVIDTYASESVVNRVAGLIDHGYEDYAVEAAISKVVASEAAWRTVDEALQLAGGIGYMREYPYDRAMRDCRINRIFEGTNDILRLFIALMAMRDAGERLEGLSSSLKGIFDHPIKGFGLLSEYALHRVALGTGLQLIPQASFTKLHPTLRGPSSVVEKGTRELAASVDKMLRKYGRGILERQFETKRLADAMIDLYTLSCVLARVDASLRKDEKAAVKEVEIACALAGQVRRRLHATFDEFDRNEDELIQSLAAHACDQERYSWDSL